jgi:hypothetical protein
MRYQLRSLLILLAVVPPILAPFGAWGWREYQAHRERQRWTEMAVPALDRRELIKLMLCPSHPSDDNAAPSDQ